MEIILGMKYMYIMANNQNNYLTDTRISLRLLSSKDKDTLFFEFSKINKVKTVNLILKNVLTKFIL